MKQNHNRGLVKGYFVMVATIAAVVIVFTTIDVQISLARIDQNDSSTWPNMSPQIRYYFIPFLSAPVALGAVAVNLIIQIVSRRHFARLLHWAFLGLASSLIFLDFPLARIGIEAIGALVISLSAALSAVLFVWWRYSVPHVRPNV